MAKNNRYGEKGGNSEISSDLTETTFFRQTSETGQILQTTILNHKTSHINLSFSGVLKLFLLEIDIRSKK